MCVYKWSNFIATFTAKSVKRTYTGYGKKQVLSILFFFLHTQIRKRMLEVSIRLTNTFATAKSVKDPSVIQKSFSHDVLFSSCVIFVNWILVIGVSCDHYSQLFLDFWWKNQANFDSLLQSTVTVPAAATTTITTFQRHRFIGLRTRIHFYYSKVLSQCKMINWFELNI